MSNVDYIKWNDLAWNYLTIEQSDRIPIIPAQSYCMQSHRPSKGKERIFSESTKKAHHWFADFLLACLKI